MSRYDRAITVFSPDGHLFQVEYAQEAVKKGSTAVGIRGATCAVLAVEKKAAAKLQDDRTVRKMALLDNHVAVAFAGLTADARILINRARVECKSHRLTVEDPVSLEYIARFVAGIKQKYTQSTGRRPFGLSTLLVGFNSDGSPHLYCTDPSGAYNEWLANAVGKNDKTVREYLEKVYTADAVADEVGAVKLALRAILEVVQSGAKNVDLGVMRWSNGAPEWEILPADRLAAFMAEIEAEREAEAEKKRARKE